MNHKGSWQHLQRCKVNTYAAAIAIKGQPWILALPSVQYPSVTNIKPTETHNEPFRI